MPDLLLHGQPVRTVFDLLGKKENDLTYSLGWGLANSPRLVSAFLRNVAAELKVDDVGADADIRLQEHIPGSGFTDVEIRTSTKHVIIEAKRGWALPNDAQLAKYAPSLTPGLAGALVIVAEGSPGFADGKYPRHVAGINGLVPVLYRSWEQLTHLTDGIAGGTSNESRLLRELARYLRGLVNMQNQRDNMVYVVSLGAQPTDWSPIPPRDIVMKHDRYFHPVGGKGSGGWPKEPPNYLGFRFDGRLQQIRHVDDVEVTDRPREFIDAFTEQHDFDRPHYIYTLGPAIVPARQVRTGPKVTRALRVWAALDLLLTCETIGNARDQTNQRLAAAGD